MPNPIKNTNSRMTDAAKDNGNLRYEKAKKTTDNLRYEKAKKKTPADTSSLTQGLERAKEFGQGARSGGVLGAAKGKGLYKRGEGLGTGPVGSAKEVSKPTPVTRPAGNNLRRPSAGLNPVKPATQTQSRRKNDPWNSEW